MIIKFKDKETARTMRWLQKAASNDKSRPILNCIRVENGQTVATDGFRLHVVPTPEEYRELEGKNIKPLDTLTVTPKPVEYEIEEELTYPDWQLIRKPLDKRVTVTMCIKQDYLADLKDMPTENGRLFISFKPGSNEPILVTTDIPGVEAVIMPMSKG